MANKTEVAYTAVLTEVGNLINSSGVTIVMTDFEQALRNASKRVFPSAHVTECNVHYDRVWLFIFTPVIRTWNKTCGCKFQGILFYTFLPSHSDGLIKSESLENRYRSSSSPVCLFNAFVSNFNFILSIFYTSIPLFVHGLVSVPDHYFIMLFVILISNFPIKTKALLKKIDKLKLTATIRSNEVPKMFLKKLMALAFLPGALIQQEYNIWRNSLPPELATQLQLFVSNYERQWLRIVSPAGFSVHSLSRRTNNVTESCKSVLADVLGIHPGAWTFLGLQSSVWLFLYFESLRWCGISQPST